MVLEERTSSLRSLDPRGAQASQTQMFTTIFLFFLFPFEPEGPCFIAVGET